MTSPTVGQVQVEILASASKLAKSLRKEVESAFKDLDLNKLIGDAVGRQKVKLPVEPVVNTDGLGEKVRRTRVPKIPVELDPVLGAFQAQVRAQTAALSREAIKIPVGADGGRLRAEVSAQIAEVQRQAKLQVPTEPGGKAEYEARLKAQLAEVGARVKQHVKVEPETGNLSGILSGLFGGLSKVLPISAGNTAGAQGLGNVLAGLVGTSTQLGGSLSGAFTAAAGPAGVIIGLAVAAGAAITGIGAAAALIVPALTAAAGAAAAIPAALVGAGAIFGTLSLGFKGISEAFKPKKAAGGGGGGNNPAQHARQVAAASRGVESARRGIAAANRSLESAERGLTAAEQNVADAQRRAQTAQAGISKARTEAAKDIDDLNRSLRGARLSEEDAALGVTEALRNLNQVKLTGNLPDIQRADLAYREAQQTLDDATANAKDLGDQTAEANKKGVEGSDKVVSALQAQVDAQQNVKDAQNGVLAAQDAVLSAQDGMKSATDGLLSAQDSLAQAQQKTAAGAAAAAAKIIKLAPAAQAFVDAVKGLKPAFESLRLDVQQRLFAGLDKTVTNLGRAWIPALKVTLGSYADTFNGFFKNLGAGLSQPKFITDIQAAAEGARQGLKKIFDSVTTSLVPAFGALSKAAGPFLSALGGEIASIVTEFSNWVLQGEKTGGLKSFFDKAAEAMHEIFTTGKLVVKIVGDIIGILVGSQGNGSKKSPIDTFNSGLKKLDDYLRDPKNQAQIQTFITQLTDGFKGAATAFGKINEFLGKFSSATNSGSVGEDIGKAIIAGLIAGIFASGPVLLGALKEAFLDSPFSLIGSIKNLLGIKSPSTVMAGIGTDVMLGLIGGITDFLSRLAATAGQIRTTVIGALGNAATWLVNSGINAVVGLANGISQRLSQLRTYTGNVRVTVINALSNAGSWLVNTGRNAIIGLANGVQSLFGYVGQVAGNARIYIQNALSNAGNYLYNHGRAVISGLINGIQSALSNLGNFLGGVGSFIQNHKGPIEKDRVLLVGAGQAIMGGLIAGIGSRKNELAAHLSDVTGIVSGTTFPALSGDLGSVASSLTSSAGLQIGIDPRSTGDWLMDGLRKNIKVTYRGNAVAALSTS